VDLKKLSHGVPDQSLTKVQKIMLRDPVPPHNREIHHVTLPQSTPPHTWPRLWRATTPPPTWSLTHFLIHSPPTQVKSTQMKLSDYHEIIGLSDLFGTLGTLFRGPISLLSLFTTLINYDINLSMCDTFLTNLLPLTDNCELLSTPKDLWFEFVPKYSEYSDISNPNIDFWYQMIVQSWFASLRWSGEALRVDLNPSKTKSRKY